MSTFYVLSYIFICVDPDPYSEYGFGSRRLQYGSGSTTLACTVILLPTTYFFLVLFDNLVTCSSLSGSCGAPSTKEGLRRNLRVQTRKRTVLPGFSCGIRIRSNFHPNYVSGSWAFLIFLHSDQTRFSHLS